MILLKRNLKWSVLFLIPFLFSCTTGKENEKNTELHGDTLTQQSDLLTLVRISDHCLAATIANPWDSTNCLGRYLLVENGTAPEIASDEWTVINVPVKSALVYSSVHTSPLEEIGAKEIIKGVADSQYFHSSFILDGINKGNIKDIGNSMSPSLEKIIDLSPEIAIVSPYENSGHGLLDKTDINVIDMADYMESTPLGRAEWILLLGALSGKLAEASAIFDGVKTKYLSLCDSVSHLSPTVKVLCEMPYNGIWYQPGGNSYMARLIKDGGGQTILKNNDSPGSVQLDISNAYEKGADADVWIIKAEKDLTRDDILSSTSLADRIHALQSGNVWFVNTNTTNFYDELAFHPEKILQDYAAMFHPEKFSSGFSFYRNLN